MHVSDYAIRRLRWRLAGLLLLRQAVTFVAAYLFLWGTAALVLRVTAATAPAPLLWGLAALPLVLAAAIVPVRRQLPKPAVLRAVLDRAGGCGGLLMAADE